MLPYNTLHLQPSPHLGGSELMPHQDIGDEDDDGDDNWQGSPQVHTGRIQVFDDPETPQLLSPAGLYTGPQCPFPSEELDDPNATQQLCHELRMETREQWEGAAPAPAKKMLPMCLLCPGSWQKMPSSLSPGTLCTSLALGIFLTSALSGSLALKPF